MAEVKTIGSGGDYSTPQAWKTARYTNTSWTEDREGHCFAELFGAYTFNAGTIKFDNEGDTNDLYWAKITADSGAEHDGRFNAKSGAGNARFRVTVTGSQYTGTIENSDGYDRIEMSWLELYNGDEGSAVVMRTSCVDISLHHCLCQLAGVSGQHTIEWDVSSGGKMYRNGLICNLTNKDVLNSVSNTKVLHNTFAGGNDCVGGGTVDEMARNWAYGANTNDYSTGQDQGENASEDGTGDDSFDNLTAANQIESATSTETTFDPTVKATGDIYQASSTTYSTATYPEIDVPITDRTGTIFGTWSIGADDTVSTGDGIDHVIQRGIARAIERGLE